MCSLILTVLIILIEIPKEIPFHILPIAWKVPVETRICSVLQCGCVIKP